ncbi:MAG: DUF4091 domain-containing protein [Phycisphaerae bacterium]|nr:DUF4091 domain-containing protein [Phycisphaerae bacterium]
MCLLIVSISFGVSGILIAAEVDKKFLATLPKKEQEMKDDVDHWGLPFADQLRRFIKARSQLQDQLGAKAPKNFLVGIQHGLEKVPLNKYWFKGKYTNEINLTAARNEYENFQVAVLPEIGKTLDNVTLSAGPLKSADGKHRIAAANIRIYRVGYVKTVPAQYPSLYTGMWPDILLPNKPIKITGIDLGLFWVEIKVPKDAPAADYEGELKLQADGESLGVKVKLHVYNFALPDRVPFPVAVWTSPSLPWGEKMSPEQYRKLASEFLKHGIDPISIGGNFVSLKDNDFQTLDENLQYCLDRGLQAFQISSAGKDPEKLKKYVAHLREKGWVDRALIYLGPDEPDDKKFKTQNIPAYQKFHAAYPDVKAFLASEYHENMDKGCDIWMTDVSTGKGPAFAAKNKGKANLWLYFCHLPIRIDYYRPLVQAPNLQIDNEAIENRLTLWLCWKYGAEGMFIWAGNREWAKPEIDRRDWKTKGWELTKKPYGFPYAGIHNGNGYLIYPGANPSIRMKILRDGSEDLGYLSILKELQQKSSDNAFKKEAEALISVPASVLVDAHYFNKDPDALLKARNQIAELIEKGSQNDNE